MVVVVHSTASRQGQDTRGHHRSAAIPHNQLSYEHVNKLSIVQYHNMWQTIANVATRAHFKQRMTHFMECATLL